MVINSVSSSEMCVCVCVCVRVRVRVCVCVCTFTCMRCKPKVVLRLHHCALVCLFDRPMWASLLYVLPLCTGVCVFVNTHGLRT